MNDEKRIFCENNLVVATKFYFRLTTGKKTDVAVRIRDLEVRFGFMPDLFFTCVPVLCPLQHKLWRKQCH